MPSYNKWAGIGNLTKDPVLRETKKSNAVVDLRVAINHQYKGEDDSLVNEVVYVDIEAFGAKARSCATTLKKGSTVFVEGRLKLDKWVDDKQEPRSRLMIRASNIQFLDGRGKKNDLEVQSSEPVSVG